MPRAVRGVACRMRHRRCGSAKRQQQYWGWLFTAELQHDRGNHSVNEGSNGAKQCFPIKRNNRQ